MKDVLKINNKLGKQTAILSILTTSKENQQVFRLQGVHVCACGHVCVSRQRDEIIHCLTCCFRLRFSFRSSSSFSWPRTRRPCMSFISCVCRFRSDSSCWIW